MTFSIRWTAVTALVVCSFISTTVRAAEEVSSKSGPIAVQSLAALDNPWGMTFLPDGSLLITEKPGRLRTFKDGKLSEPITGVPKVSYYSQGGLLDVEIDPQFEKNKLVYLSFVEAADEQPKDPVVDSDARLGSPGKKEDNVVKGGAVARGRLEGGKLEDVTVIWRQVPKTLGRGHFGGRLVFSPDGTLFITSGERQRFEPAQDLSTNLGKIIRINPDGTIPKDNPFVGKPDARPDIWTIGNRNPLGAAINPATKQLWINEMGPKGGDELNLIQRGVNYGWPIVSEGKHYNDAPIPHHDTHPEFTPPVYQWTPVISPSGMIFYGGEKFSAWRGNALLGGLSSKALIRVTLEGDKAKDVEVIDMSRRIRDVIEAPDGAVLLLSDGDKGELLRLTPKDDAQNK